MSRSIPSYRSPAHPAPARPRSRRPSSRSSAARRSPPPTSRATPSIATTAPRCARRWPRRPSAATSTSATSARRPICSRSWRRRFATMARPAPATTRHYVHDDEEAKLYGADPGTFTEWGPLPEKLGPAVLRGPAWRRRHRQGQHRPACRSQDRRRARHQSRMDPEAASRPQRPRLFHRGRHRHHPAADAGLRATTSVRNSPRPTSISSACRRSILRTRSSPAGSRRRTNRWW